MATEMTIQEVKELLGKEVSLGNWFEVTQDRINQFADCTGDHQWIHVDLEKAAKGPFGKPIAHGFLTLSLLPSLQSGTRFSVKGARMGINYGLNKVRFLSPVPVGSRIRVRGILSGVEEKEGGRILLTTTQTIEIEGSEKPACVAETLSLIYV
ncbi:MAG: enoyl-CoA hydratase [Deltaproteobacteria bacterium RBG_13_43_22]|jgi:acyl dehydratase|nr:MAG: enoyl-CoA hydratase [Deltaproteobacteria bacterium RBG_13_43_22]